MRTRKQKHDLDAKLVPGQGIDLQATGFGSHRRLGELAEAKFLAKATSLGFGVARPWGDERYDLILDSGYHFARVQVKSTIGRTPSEYGVMVASKTMVAYDETAIDFLVAYLVPEDIWYVVPVKVLKGMQCLYFYPRGRGTSRWEKYREAWCQMACPLHENGPSEIVTPRCREDPARKALCPLKVLR
jgi:PD-(D/E)XK nuclease superfamily protein